MTNLHYFYFYVAYFIYLAAGESEAPVKNLRRSLTDTFHMCEQKLEDRTHDLIGQRPLFCRLRHRQTWKTCPYVPCILSFLNSNVPQSTQIEII